MITKCFVISNNSVFVLRFDEKAAKELSNRIYTIRIAALMSNPDPRPSRMDFSFFSANENFGRENPSARNTIGDASMRSFVPE